MADFKTLHSHPLISRKIRPREKFCNFQTLSQPIIFLPIFLYIFVSAGKFKIDLQIKEGSHSTGEDITKQINDKERVAAALENPNLRETVDNCINNQDY